MEQRKITFAAGFLGGVLASALFTALEGLSQAHAAEVQICGQKDTLKIVSVDAAIDAKITTTLSGVKCATRGHLAGEWVLDGDVRSMYLGVVRSGDGLALLSTSPRYQLLGPVTAEIVFPKNLK